MTGPADLMDTDQEDVGVAIDGDRLDNLDMPGSPPLVPRGLSRPRVKMSLARGQSLDDGRLIHPRHHQDVSSRRILDDRRNEAIGRPFERAEEGKIRRIQRKLSGIEED